MAGYPVTGGPAYCAPESRPFNPQAYEPLLQQLTDEWCAYE